MKFYEIVTDYALRLLYFIVNFIKMILGAIISIICCNMLLIQVLPLLILGIDVGAIIFCLGLYGCVSVTVASIEQLYTYNYLTTITTMLMSVYIGTVVYFESLLDAPILLLYSIVFELLQTTGQNVALIARIQAFLDCCGVTGPRDYHYLRCTTIWIKVSSFFGYATHNCSPESIEEEVGCAPKMTAYTKSILLTFIIFGCLLDIVLIFLTRFVLHFLNQRKREEAEAIRHKMLKTCLAPIKPKPDEIIPPALD